MMYFSETDKVRERIDPKYLEGKVIDIGCGTHKIKPDAIGVDGRDVDGVDIVLKNERAIYNLFEFHELREASCVFSSHCLEHLHNDYAAVSEWASLLMSGGYFILYLPDGRYYDSRNNPEHMRDYNYDDFLFFFKQCFCGEGKNFKGENFKPMFNLIESGMDIGEDKYSFFLIAKKL